ncbi:pseudouridine synthase [Brevundimonas sp. AAP58]|uniref:pseudouridine synthase n=1 Tax=Brevundimonas sp. AAP58 TaxID=1523422 RepID=UPI0006B93843|nr:pseudouridine synthase [Brevundimonas sp. AAP58]KPF82449.1 pseudouridine synthase [Brevundimonas sp. AAP58]
MARHPDDNDKKPSPRQAPRAHKPGDRPRSGAARPGSASAARYETLDKSASGRGSGGGRAYAPDKCARPEKPIRGKRYSADPKAGGGKPGAKEAPAEPKRTERIAKAMARAGIASRREVERLIGLGKVAVNGRILDTPATLVTRDDVITVDGKPIAATQATRVWRYNKPVGLLTSHNDPAGRPTVFDALPAGLPRVISVGRLDINTEGLLLLTNDGELSRALELPETALVRQYRARARGRVTQEQLDKLKEGVTVDGVRYGPVEATIDKAKTNEDGSQSANLWISVSITEGKNREVRKVLESVGLTVNRLIRLAYGPFQLGTLPTGSVEEVGPRVIRELLAQHIRPENLPQGNTVETPAPIPGRRTGAPKVVGKSGSAISDPSRKPSRVRAAETAAEEGAARAARAPKKAGWAKAAPKFEHPKKAFKPRTRPDGEGGDDRAKRPFKPREDKIIGPKSPTWARDTDKRAGGAKRPFKPRTDGTAGRPAGRGAGGPRKPSGPRGPRSGG